MKENLEKKLDKIPLSELALAMDVYCNYLNIDGRDSNSLGTFKELVAYSIKKMNENNVKSADLLSDLLPSSCEDMYSHDGCDSAGKDGGAPGM
ncbi:hypothetical protein JXB27_04695 [Candidatus Woesearchaeota archaeon]|nr:hypothetical protein [Candidatus Woesearchaeota archaeon]